MTPEERGYRLDMVLLSTLGVLLAAYCFGIYYTGGQTLLYGDAVAHINIARRVFDSRDPGPLQLGTVWLPFPHVVTIPFIIIDWFWYTGVGASVPSMTAFIFGIIGMYRLIRGRLPRAIAWAAAAIYALNPSLLYMQSTAMTEPIFLATLIWAIVYLDEFARGLFPPANSRGLAPRLPAWRALERCGMVLAAGIMTRYDGWVFAFVIGMSAVALLARRLMRGGEDLQRGRLLRSMASLLLLCALMPVLWLAHNYAISGHPLDWYDGPYSAKAIEQRTTHPGDPPYPGEDNMRVASLYFLKAAKLNMSENGSQPWIFAFAVAGAIFAVYRFAEFGAFLLLWMPLPFYAYAIAYGSVPIFIPTWWPFSYYNVRYGLEMLPAFAASIALAGWAGSKVKPRMVAAIAPALAVCCVGLGYLSSTRAIPICQREARVNARTRLELEYRLARDLTKMPRNSTLMMYTGEYVGALQICDIHLDRVVNETTRTTWDAARSAPAAVADYIIAVKGDPVWDALKATNFKGVELMDAFVTPGKPMVAVYRSKWRVDGKVVVPARDLTPASADEK